MTKLTDHYGGLLFMPDWLAKEDVEGLNQLTTVADGQKVLAKSTRLHFPHGVVCRIRPSAGNTLVLGWQAAVPSCDQSRSIGVALPMLTKSNTCCSLAEQWFHCSLLPASARHIATAVPYMEAKQGKSWFLKEDHFAKAEIKIKKSHWMDFPSILQNREQTLG